MMVAVSNCSLAACTTLSCAVASVCDVAFIVSSCIVKTIIDLGKLSTKQPEKLAPGPGDIDALRFADRPALGVEQGLALGPTLAVQGAPDGQRDDRPRNERQVAKLVLGAPEHLIGVQILQRPG